ncbi:MAG: transposase [Oligoflexia bacterium]
MKKRFTEEQIIGVLKRLESGEDLKSVCRDVGVHMQTVYVWKRKYGGMEVSDAKKLRTLEAENTKLKRMLANAMMDIEDLKFLQTKNF